MRNPSFRVGIDSYSLRPLGFSPFEVVDWAVLNGAEGVQFSDGAAAAAPGAGPGPASDRGFLRELRDYAARNRVALEWGGAQHVPMDLASGGPRDVAAVNRRAAEQARELGVRVVRSCSGGLMRWGDALPPTEDLLRLMERTLREQAPMLRDLGVVLAVETHFEFTTFELLRAFERCGARPGEFVGICLDTMNLLTMLEDPVAAAARVKPWVVSTHVKDGGLLLDEDGFRSFPAEVGAGVVDIPAILRLLAVPGRTLALSLEDHGGEFRIPIADPAFLARFPDLTVAEMASLLRLAARTRRLQDDHGLRPLDRSRWPQVCEARVKRGLRALRRMAEDAA